MSHDELRQYAPTAQRREKLRQAGISSVSPAPGQIGAWLVVALAVYGGWRWLVRCAVSYLARDLQSIMVEGESAERLAGYLGEWFMAGAGVVVGLSVVAYLVGWGMAVGQGGGRGRSLTELWTNPQRAKKHRPDGTDLMWRVILGGVGVGGMVIIGREMLMQWSEVTQWSDLWEWQRWGGVVVRGGALVAGLGVMQALWYRYQYLAHARMTRREVLWEARETQGSWLLKTLRQAGRGKRREAK